MDKQILNAEERKITGRKVKKLRKTGMLPGNIFGKKIKSLSVAIKTQDFNKVYKEVGETGLLELQIGKDNRAVLVANVQKDPVSDVPLHVDFHQVDLKEKVTADVPIEVIGESPAEKQGIGTLVQYLNEIEVEALPADLPEKFEVNAENLIEVDHAVSVKDLKVDTSKVEVKVDLEEIIAKIEPLQKEEEVAPALPEEVVPTEGAEVPAAGEEATGELTSEAPEAGAKEESK